MEMIFPSAVFTVNGTAGSFFSVTPFSFSSVATVSGQYDER